MCPAGNRFEVPDGRDARLLPTRSLSPDDFEDFTERLLSAHRFAPPPVRHVARVQRWGRRGDAQDGIDFEGTWNDGTTIGWQCKRLDSLTPGMVRRFIRECTFRADGYYIVYSGEASSEARKEARSHPGWDILDQRGLGRLLDDLPHHKRRDVLDETWGPTVRRHYLHLRSEDAFLGIEDIVEARRDAVNPLNDLAPPVGRDDEAQALDIALDRECDWPPIVLVTGAGGTGKTRLIAEALNSFQERTPQTAVIWLSPGRGVNTDPLRELPLTPAVIVIDDAHQDIRVIHSLAGYVRQRDDTQLVLGFRDHATDLILSELLRSGFREAQIERIPLPRLTLSEGRKLVESLSSGLDIRHAFAEQLARQARDAPFMAVLTLNLLRSGELTGPLALDTSLRRQVMARYEDVLTAGIAGFNRTQVRRMMAVLAALSPAQIDDETRIRVIALSSMAPVEALRLLQGLREQGILLDGDGRSRIVPEILADQVLEEEAAVGGIDTGFVAEVWEALGDRAAEELLTSIGALDWRLSQRNGPSVMTPVWGSLEDQITRGSYAALRGTVSRCGSLAYTQPARLMWLLGLITDRLDALDGNPEQGASEEDALWTMFGGPRPGREQIERLLPSLYGSCAISDPALLEEALDRLWVLARRDSRQPHSTPEGAQRIVVDRLANLGAPPHESFPRRIVRAVGRWLQEPRRPTEAVSPLFAVQPLLAKEGMRTELADRRTMNFTSYLVNPIWARPLRDEIRHVLLKHASDENLPLLAEIIGCLEAALRPAFGMAGQPVTDEQVTGWEDDDLATLDSLAAIARDTKEAVVRRRVRGAVEFSASHAASCRLRHAAMSLVTTLDQSQADDLADYFVNSDSFGGLESQRGRLMPTFEHYLLRLQGTEADCHQHLEQDPSEGWEEYGTRTERKLTQLIDALWAGSRRQALANLETEMRKAAEVSSRAFLQLNDLFAHITAHRAHLLPDLISSILDSPDGPLYRELPVLLEGLRQSHREVLEKLLTELPQRPPHVRFAIARASVSYGWATVESTFRPAINLGTSDPEEKIRQEFMAALPLAHEPLAVAHALVERQASEETLERVLRISAHPSLGDWPSRLDREEATAVLDLAKNVRRGGSEIERILAHIASAHPNAVLDHLVQTWPDGLSIPVWNDRLRAAFGEQREAVAQWIRDQCRGGTDANRAGTVLAYVVGDPLPSAIREVLLGAVSSMSEEEVHGLLDLLSCLNAWAAHHLDLARQILKKVRSGGDDAATETVLKRIRRGFSPSHWTGNGSTSPEIDAALTALTSALETEHDGVLIGLIDDGIAALRAEAEGLKQMIEEDDF